MSDKTASFQVKVDTKTTARQDAQDLEALKASITASIDKVKQYGAAYRSLRGASDEVKKARADLKASLETERDAVSRANLAMVKQGTTYEAVISKERALTREREKAAKAAADEAKRASAAQQAKELEAIKAALTATKDRADSMKEALRSAGGPLQTVSDRFTSMKKILTGGGGLVFALGLTAAGIAAVTVAGGGAVFALAHFALEGANALRSMALMREAAAGSAENAKAFGHQIDALANKVPQTRAELNELAVSLSRSLMGTRIGGQGIVDTFNAVAQASAAMGQQAGKAIEDLITRGKRWGQLGINPQELLGTGIQFQDVASELAKRMKVGVADARNALVMGRVQIDQGAAAIRAVVERRFGSINTRSLLSLDVMAKKLKDDLQALTSGVKLGPFLAGFSSLEKLFSQTTASGQALKAAVTGFGDILGIVFGVGVKRAGSGFKQLEIQVLRFEVGLLRNKKAIATWAGTIADKVPSVQTMLTGLRIAADVATGALIGLAARGFAAAASAAADLLAALGPVGILAGAIALEAAYIYKGLKEIDWDFLGTAISKGLENAWKSVTGAAGRLAEGIKTTFRNILGIHSPSAVFRDFGRQTTKGYEQGIDQGSADVQRAANDMAPAPPRGGAFGAGRGGPSKVEVTVVAPPHHSGDIGQALTSRAFRALLTQAIEEALLGEAIPTQAPAGG